MRRRITAVALCTTMILVGAAPAWAGHDHFMETPSGKCHQLARGQTVIDDSSHGGYHRYHVNVHVALAGDGTLNATSVEIAKNTCP